MSDRSKALSNSNSRSISRGPTAGLIEMPRVGSAYFGCPLTKSTHKQTATTNPRGCDIEDTTSPTLLATAAVFDWNLYARVQLLDSRSYRRHSMSKLNLAAGALYILLSTAAFAQTPGAVDSNPPAYPANPSTLTTGPASADIVPARGDPLTPRTDTGLDKVANDGVSTAVVPAVKCGTAARETDGTTTCVGIPGPPGSVNAKSGSSNREK